jgi:hypothetical protein
LFLGDGFAVERRDISFRKSTQNYPGDHPAFCNEYRPFTGEDEWVKRSQRDVDQPPPSSASALRLAPQGRLKGEISFTLSFIIRHIGKLFD